MIRSTADWGGNGADNIIWKHSALTSENYGHCPSGSTRKCMFRRFFMAGLGGISD